MPKIAFIWLMLLSLNVIAAPKNSCTPNLIGADMCIKAREFVDYMAPQLPMQMNSNLVWESVASVGTAVVATYRFTYDEEDLLTLLQNAGISVEDTKQAMRNMANNMCSQKVPRGFINLGGKWVINYVYSDGQMFLQYELSECPK